MYNANLKITTLLIDDLNIDKDEVSSLCEFIVSELGKEVPPHFSRFSLMHKITDRKPTAIETLKMLKNSYWQWFRKCLFR